MLVLQIYLSLPDLQRDRQYEDMAPSHLSPVRIMFMLAAGHDAFYEGLPEQLHCISTWKSSMPATRAIFVVGVA
jgi:hypothetical protein